MKLARVALTLFGVLAIPAAASAGWIEFWLAPGNITHSPWAPALGTALVPVLRPGGHDGFDPTSGTPRAVEVIDYEPWRLPTPAARDIHPDGTTHWNNDGYFDIDVRLTDLASGQSAELSFGGRAHMYNRYSTQSGWTGVTDFWFLDEHTVTLGENDYTVWGTNHYDGGPPTLAVWVGSNPPVHDSPEPGTLALAGLGLIPFGFRAIRRKRTN